MANWNGLAVAAGLAGALAVFGPAWAQNGPGAATAPGGASSGSTATGDQSAGAPRDSGKSMSDRNESTTGTGSDRSAYGASSTGSSERSATGSTSGGGKLDKKLQEDVQKVHAANQAEVHMGQMGQQQATSPEVKQYAQQLEQDHQQMDQQLTQTAQTMGVQLEGKGFQDRQKDARKEMQKLQGKTGRDFDKEFLKMMVKDHERDIKEVQKISKQARKDNQGELASTLDQAVAKMQTHLQTAKQLEKTAGKGKSSARGTTSGSGSTGSGSSGSSTGGSFNSGSSASPGSGSSPSDASSPSKNETGSTGNDASGTPSKPSGSGQ